MLAKLETVRCSGSSTYIRSIAIPQLALFFEVDPVSLPVALDQDAEEAKTEIAGSPLSARARTG